MTAIVGIVKDGRVYMGGDSSAVADDIAYPVVNKKVFVRSGMLFGYAGSFRYGQVIQHHMPEVKLSAKVDALHAIVSGFVPVLRESLEGVGGIASDDEEDAAGDCLIGYKGHLFLLQSNFSVLEPVEGVAVLGSSEGILLGAVAALSGRRPEYRINRAMSIAASYSNAVLPPFNIVSI